MLVFCCSYCRNSNMLCCTNYLVFAAGENKHKSWFTCSLWSPFKLGWLWKKVMESSLYLDRDTLFTITSCLLCRQSTQLWTTVNQIHGSGHALNQWCMAVLFIQDAAIVYSLFSTLSVTTTQIQTSSQVILVSCVEDWLDFAHFVMLV